MADVTKSIRYDQAFNELSTHLERFSASVRSLYSSEIEQSYALSTDGWRICIECDGDEHTLDYLIDQNFPYSVPRLALPSYKKESRWPHLFGGNYLCLLPNTVEIAPNSPINVFECLVNEAHVLIEKCSSGELDDDFGEEFISYWTSMVTEPETPIFSLLEPSSLTRHIDLVKGPNSFVACERYMEGQDWLVNRHGKQYKEAPWKKALLVWLGTPPQLKEFSQTNHSILSWLDGLDNAANKKIKKALNKPECMIIFGFDVGDGTALAAVTVKPSNTKQKPKGKKQAIKASLADNGQAKLFEVKRVDHSWLHGRDHGEQSQSIKRKTVVLVGCGSVGGSVAHLLAEAGVGSIHCIDPGIMEWGNVGRHVLGSESVGKIKSDCVANQLQARFPHLKFKSYGSSTWQQVYGAKHQIFKDADLIVYSESFGTRKVLDFSLKIDSSPTHD